MFKLAKKKGYKHYLSLTIEELDDLEVTDDKWLIESTLVQKWLKINFSITIEIYRTLSGDGNIYGVSINKWNNEFTENLYNDYFKTSEQALNEAILYTLNNLI
jgi:hypothetical protein